MPNTRPRAPGSHFKLEVAFYPCQEPDLANGNAKASKRSVVRSVKRRRVNGFAGVKFTSRSHSRVIKRGVISRLRLAIHGIAFRFWWVFHRVTLVLLSFIPGCWFIGACDLAIAVKRTPKPLHARYIIFLAGTDIDIILCWRRRTKRYALAACLRLLICPTVSSVWVGFVQACRGAE